MIGLEVVHAYVEADTGWQGKKQFHLVVNLTKISLIAIGVIVAELILEKRLKEFYKIEYFKHKSFLR